jgi:branched-subunit amino acid aminotransferase/4-amino-4-deoxychorismate lyase
MDPIEPDAFSNFSFHERGQAWLQTRAKIQSLTTIANIRTELSSHLTHAVKNYFAVIKSNSDELSDLNSKATLMERIKNVKIDVGELKLMMLVSFDQEKLSKTIRNCMSSILSNQISTTLTSSSASSSILQDFAPASVAFADVFDVIIHVSRLGNVPAPPVIAQVRYAHRNNPHIKDSAWVKQAKHLENMMQKDENEIVMVSDDNQFLEGLSSNFFAIDKSGTVWTAEKGVLPGTVQQIVINVCEKYCIPLKKTSATLPIALPFMTTSSKSTLDLNWQGCMITSTSRLCLPIDELRFPDESMKQPAKIVFCKKEYPLAYRIQELVAKEVETESEEVFDSNIFSN